jgi:nitroreductase
MMDLVEAIQSRRSIRAYKPDPVKKETIEEILAIAVRAPSSMNTQPWKISVLAGDVLNCIREENVSMLMSGKMPGKDVPFKPYEGEYKQRQVELAKDLFAVLNIARDDKEKRDAWMQQGFRFFDAPAAIILSLEESTDQPSGFSDLGGLAQTICLTALHFGLGTCIMGQGIMYPEAVRKYASIPKNHRMWVCITLGYPAANAPANSMRSRRDPVEHITSWYGFGEMT